MACIDYSRRGSVGRVVRVEDGACTSTITSDSKHGFSAHQGLSSAPVLPKPQGDFWENKAPPPLGAHPQSKVNTMQTSPAARARARPHFPHSARAPPGSHPTTSTTRDPTSSLSLIAPLHGTTPSMALAVAISSSEARPTIGPSGRSKQSCPHWRGVSLVHPRQRLALPSMNGEWYGLHYR